MKQRTMALLLMAALALSLLGTAALAAEGDPAAPASSAIQTEPTATHQPGSRRPRGRNRRERRALSRLMGTPQRTERSRRPPWRSTYRTRWGPSPSET